MAVLTRYWNPRSSGGDGTTEALSGANAAYASLNAAEAAEQKDLVAAGDSIVFQGATGDTAGGGGTNLDPDTTAVTFDGWTTGSGNDITIQTQVSRIDGRRHSGLWSTSRVRFEVTDTNILTIKEDYVTVDGLQFWITTPTSNKRCIILEGITSEAASQITIKNNVIRQEINGGNVTAGIVCPGATADIYNNAFFDGNNASIVDYHATGDTATVNAYNNSSYCQSAGLHAWQAGSTWTAKNNLVQQFSTPSANCFATNGAATFDTASNNLSEDASAPGADSVTSTTLTLSDPTLGDLHLVDGDMAAVNAGIGPDSDASVPSTDITGESRSGTTCDIGMDEGQFGPYTAESRKSASGIWLPQIPGVTPNAGKDAEWRLESAWSYSDIAADAPPAGGDIFFEFLQEIEMGIKAQTASGMSGVLTE